jgi:hypothetical protein
MNMIDFQVGDRVKWWNGLSFLFNTNTGIVKKVSPKSVVVSCEDTGNLKRIKKSDLSWCVYQPNN